MDISCRSRHHWLTGSTDSPLIHSTQINLICMFGLDVPYKPSKSAIQAFSLASISSESISWVSFWPSTHRWPYGSCSVTHVSPQIMSLGPFADGIIMELTCLEPCMGDRLAHGGIRRRHTMHEIMVVAGTDRQVYLLGTIMFTMCFKDNVSRTVYHRHFERSVG